MANKFYVGGTYLIKKETGLQDYDRLIEVVSIKGKEIKYRIIEINEIYSYPRKNDVRKMTKDSNFAKWSKPIDGYNSPLWKVLNGEEI